MNRFVFVTCLGCVAIAHPTDNVDGAVVETVQMRGKVCFAVSRIKSNKNMRPEDSTIIKFKYDEIVANTNAVKVALDLGNKQLLSKSLEDLRRNIVALGEDISAAGQTKGPVLDSINTATKALDVAKSLLVRYLDERKAVREAKRKAINAALTWKSWVDIDADGKACNQ